MGLAQKLKKLFSLAPSDIPLKLIIPPDLKSPEYEYPVDKEILRILKTLVPITFLTRLVVDLLSSYTKVILSAGATKVTPNHCGRIYNIAKDCADILGIKMPDIFIKHDPIVNAYTLGDDSKALVVLHSALVDNYDEKELRFVIGHEMGHIKSRHMLYRTLVFLLFEAGKLEKYIPKHIVTILELIKLPSTIYLPAWSRRSEITADRAGFICAQNIEVSCRALIKLDLGVRKFDLAIDPEQYLNQLIDIEKGIWKYTEYADTHPFTPKRVKCIRLFANSEFVIKRLFGQEMKSYNLSKKELDKEVSRVIRVGFKKIPKSVYLNFIMIKLAISIAWVDGKPGQKEKTLLDELIKFSDLSDEKKAELKAFLNKGLAITGVYDEVRKIKVDNRALINLCVDICKCDGRVSKEEMSALYNLGAILKLDKRTIRSLVAKKWIRTGRRIGRRIKFYSKDLSKKLYRISLRKR